MVFLVDIYTSVHRVRDSTISEYSTGVSTVINVANNNSVVCSVNAQVGQQWLTVFDPCSGRNDPTRAADVTHDEVSKHTT